MLPKHQRECQTEIILNPTDKCSMLSYQHGYHAGGLADLIKHLTITRILNYMLLKDKPMVYIETHAGRGIYDLEDPQALTTGEAELGIKRLWEHRAKLPEVFSLYFKTLSLCNHQDKLRYYPGSPSLAIHALRPIDRLFFSERHPGEYQHLKTLAHQNLRVTCHQGDGLAQLNALLPPIERRGLILIDPSYEIKTEYREIPTALKKAYLRFTTGVYCIWYPLVDDKWHRQLLVGLQACGAKNNLRLELYQKAQTGKNTKGCGLWIINPPFVLFEELKLICESLRPLFHSFYLLESYDHHSTPGIC